MKRIPIWVKGIVIIVVLYLFFLQPIPYYIERPGGALELDTMIEVDGEYAEDPGTYMMTTVSIMQATPFTYLSHFLPYTDVVPESALFGEIENYEQYNMLQRYYMESSIHSAVVAAFDAAEQPYDLTYNGVYVMSVTENSSFAESLQMGDVITGIDGTTFENTEAFMEYIKNQEVGQTVSIEYQRNGTDYVSEGELVQLEETGQPGIGITLVDQSTVETDPEVSVHSGEIGGPSAGLMYSLQIYSQITQSNLKDGRRIAGTGTIADDGSVGPIGGIDKKIVAADKEGAVIFFAPHNELEPELKEQYPEYETNYEIAVNTAEDIGTDMVIVPVQSLNDAIDYLEQSSAEASLPSPKQLNNLLVA